MKKSQRLYDIQEELVRIRALRWLVPMAYKEFRKSLLIFLARERANPTPDWKYKQSKQ